MCCTMLLRWESIVQRSRQSCQWSFLEMTQQQRLNGRPASGAYGARQPDQAQRARARWRRSPCSERTLWSLSRRPAGVHPSLAAASACQPSPVPSRSDNLPPAVFLTFLHNACHGCGSVSTDRSRGKPGQLRGMIAFCPDIPCKSMQLPRSMCEQCSLESNVLCAGTSMPCSQCHHWQHACACIEGLSAGLAFAAASAAPFARLCALF